MGDLDKAWKQAQKTIKAPGGWGVQATDYVSRAINFKEGTYEYWKNKALAHLAPEAPKGPTWPSYPEFNFDFTPVEFIPAEVDFLAEYEKIRDVNEPLVRRYSAEAAGEAQVLSSSFTRTNLENFEMAMDRIQPGYRGILSKQSEVVSSWLSGRVPEDVQNQILIQASNRALQSGAGEGGFSRNLLARDFGRTSMDLQEAGVGAASQLVNAARQTARSLVADPGQLYGANFQAKLQGGIMTPGQYVGQVAQQAQFNASGAFQASQFNASMGMQVQQMNAQMELARYQDQLNRQAAEQARQQANAPTGPFGKLFGNEIGAVLDPVASIAVPVIATVATGGNVMAGAAAGAAWGGLSAGMTGQPVGQAALMGGVTGGVTAYSFGKPATAWWQNRGIAGDPLASEEALSAYLTRTKGWDTVAPGVSATNVTPNNQGSYMPNYNANRWISGGNLMEA